MKFQGNTVSQPVVGREAKLLSEAIRKGESLMNDNAKATVAKILEARKQHSGKSK